MMSLILNHPSLNQRTKRTRIRTTKIITVMTTPRTKTQTRICEGTKMRLELRAKVRVSKGAQRTGIRACGCIAECESHEQCS